MTAFATVDSSLVALSAILSMLDNALHAMSSFFCIVDIADYADIMLAST